MVELLVIYYGQIGILSIKDIDKRDPLVLGTKPSEWSLLLDSNLNTVSLSTNVIFLFPIWKKKPPKWVIKKKIPILSILKNSYLVEHGGFKPPTSSMRMMYSINWTNAPTNQLYSFIKKSSNIITIDKKTWQRYNRVIPSILGKITERLYE